MADFYNSIKQIRVTELLGTGAADPSAVAVSSTIPKELTIKPVYIDGEEKEQRGGDAVVCTITEEDTFKGVDLELLLASLDYSMKEAIAGGTLVMSGPDIVGWESINTLPGPFKLEVWVPHYETPSIGTEVEGALDGYLKVDFPFCKGRLADHDHSDKKFGEDKFSIKARPNPSSGDGAMHEEIVSTIV
jgi:hypothetical protein